MYYKTFDTHKYIKSLKETGFNEQQAEMLVKSLLESRDFDLSILATREQVAEVKSDLQKEIAATNDAIKQSKVDTLKWTLPLIMTAISMIAVLMIKLF